MNVVFKDLILQGVVIYLDNILVYNSTEEEHVLKLREVLELPTHHQVPTVQEFLARYPHGYPDASKTGGSVVIK